MTKNTYLLASRLEDVIFLIQHLGLGEHYSLERGKVADGVSPRSGPTWEAVARDHPEFFRVLESGSVTLAYRYYLREKGNPPKLPDELVQRLVENAIALQERQAKRSEVWKVWGTFIAAVVAAILGLAQLAVGQK